MLLNAFGKPADAQQIQRQQRRPKDKVAANANGCDVAMEEAVHHIPKDSVPDQRPKQRPCRNAAVKKAPAAKKAAAKSKPAKTVKAAAQAAGRTGQRHAQTRMQAAAATNRQSPEPVDTGTSDQDRSLHLPPAKPSRKVRSC